MFNARDVYFFALFAILSVLIWKMDEKIDDTLTSAPAFATLERKDWQRKNMKLLWIEREEMGKTPVRILRFPSSKNLTIIFKDETVSRTESLKHRYSWSLISWALISGHIKEDTTVYEASSGNTATSLAYFCRLIGVKFVAIVPDTIEVIKQERIEKYGAEVIRVPIEERLRKGKEYAENTNGFFMNQFKNAFYAEEYHEAKNGAHASVNILSEMSDIQLDYFVHSAGTGGTITSIGRYVKKYALATEVVLADTEHSIYYDYLVDGRYKTESGSHLWVPPGISGIGYGPMGPAVLGSTTSLDPHVIDHAVKVPDIATVAALQVIQRIGINGGVSTAINFLASLQIAFTHRNGGENLTIGTILGDPAKFYTSTYLNSSWINDNYAKKGGMKAIECWIYYIEKAVKDHINVLEEGHSKC